MKYIFCILCLISCSKHNSSRKDDIISDNITNPQTNNAPQEPGNPIPEPNSLVLLVSGCYLLFLLKKNNKSIWNKSNI